jgi:hypothetical protein
MIPESVKKDLMERKHVKGVGMSPDKEEVVVFVDEKLPEDMLKAKDIVPELVQIEDSWYNTTVEGVGEPFALKRRKEKHRPAPAGVSVGHQEITAGTLGSVPLLDNRGRQVFLTNAHVAAPPGKVENMDVIIQPGEADGGTEEDGVGNVVGWSEIDKDGSNKSDSALVSSNDLRNNTIFDLGPMKELSTESDESTAFVKSGRTTGVTDGSLVATDVTIDVRGYYPNESVEFVEVDAFSPMSSGGDSGSIICEARADGRYGTHLLFAGSPQVTFGIPMENVFEEHGELEVKYEPTEDWPGKPDNDLTLWQRIMQWLGGLFT